MSISPGDDDDDVLQVPKGTPLYLVLAVAVSVISVALAVSYQSGALDALMEKIGVLYFKGKAKAEEKKMEAEGEREGEDFIAGEIKGNKQAAEVVDGLGGGISGLKKGF